MAKHALRRENDERLAPEATRLAAKQMEILRGRGRLTDVHVAFGGELHETLDARAGMFRALAFVAVREKEHEAGRQTPLVFAGADELIDNDLCPVHKIAELRFPEDQALGIVPRKAVFEAEAAGLRK